MSKTVVYGNNFEYRPQKERTYVAIVYVDERGRVSRTLEFHDYTAAWVLADCRNYWPKLNVPIDATLWERDEDLLWYELGPQAKISGGDLEIRVTPNGRSDSIAVATSREQLEQDRERIRQSGKFFQ